jgi:hypothetical protein
VHQGLRARVVPRGSALDEVAREREGRAGEPDQRDPQLLAEQADRLEGERFVHLGFEGAEPSHTARVADRVLHHRAETGFDPNRHADRRERDHDVREHDRGVERHPPERLEGELDGELGRPDDLEDVAIPAQLPVLGQVSAGLAHEPHRGAVDGFAPEGAQESVVHGPQDTEEGPAPVREDDGRHERGTLLGRRTH